MDTKLILKFLKDLTNNNTIDWMKSNRAYYDLAKSEFENLVLELTKEIKFFDKSIIII